MSDQEGSATETLSRADEDPEEEGNIEDGEDEEETNSEENSEEQENGEEIDENPDIRILKPITREELQSFQAAQEKTGIIYISRIPPGMRPSKVRHLMSMYGQVGRIYLQQEDPKRAYLRKKYTSTKKAHYTEGWVEFKDKKVGRAVAEMLNAQPIGGKKGTRWRDDVWTMKYLPRFKWFMLTEQIAHEAALHRDKLRMELEQSRHEQRDYLRQVELARVLDKRKERKRKRVEELGGDDPESHPQSQSQSQDRSTPIPQNKQKRSKEDDKATIPSIGALDTVLDSIFW